MNRVYIIPAHLKSKRFPNKLIQKFGDKRIIDIVIEKTKTLLGDVVLATEDDLLIDIAKEHKIQAFKMGEVGCGSERAYHFYKANSQYDYYITIPADEVALDMKEVSKALKDNHNNITTLYCDFYNQHDLVSPLSCKIVSTIHDKALYFSRSVIPIHKQKNDLIYDDLSIYKKHVGVFIFSKSFLSSSSKVWGKSRLATIEGLEQNRFLEYGYDIHLRKIKHIGFGIDQPEQIEQLLNRIQK